MHTGFFDFDQTCTPKHTFFENQSQDNDVCEEQYKKGKVHAENNLKTNLEHFLKHDKDHISAIVTHHNNPAFIAGYLAKVLNKELIYKKTISSAHPAFAIDLLEVPDTEYPLLISYCAKLGKEHKEVMLTSPDKNTQLSDLRQILLEIKAIQEDTKIDFYDDTEANIKASLALPFIAAHHIDALNPDFKIVDKSTDSIIQLARCVENFGMYVASGYDSDEAFDENQKVISPLVYTTNLCRSTLFGLISQPDEESPDSNLSLSR